MQTIDKNEKKNLNFKELYIYFEGLKRGLGWISGQGISHEKTCSGPVISNYNEDINNQALLAYVIVIIENTADWEQFQMRSYTQPA